ncbi:MAG: hypothetical protein WC683_10075 [bacterium]
MKPTPGPWARWCVDDHIQAPGDGSGRWYLYDLDEFNDGPPVAEFYDEAKCKEVCANLNTAECIRALGGDPIKVAENVGALVALTMDTAKEPYHDSDLRSLLEALRTQARHILTACGIEWGET